jgi:hypothetical protein
MTVVDLDASRRLDGLAIWLADHANLNLIELHEAFCNELVARSFQLWRSSLGLELLHPEQSGIRSLWTMGEGIKKSGAPRGIETSPEYLNSPVRVVDDTERPFRRRLLGLVQEMPLLEELRQAGATDTSSFRCRSSTATVPPTSRSSRSPRRDLRTPSSPRSNWRRGWSAPMPSGGR